MICIETLAFQDAMERLADCHADSGVDDNPQSMRLLGVSGVGKSFVFKEYCLRHPPVHEEEITRVPVVHVQIPSKPTRRAIFSAFLRAVQIHVGPGSADALRDRAQFLYKQCCVEFVCVDEVQHLIDRGQARTFVSTRRTHLDEGRAFGGEREQVVSCAASDAAAARRCGYAAASAGVRTRPSDRHTDRAH